MLSLCCQSHEATSLSKDEEKKKKSTSPTLAIPHPFHPPFCSFFCLFVCFVFVFLCGIWQTGGGIKWLRCGPRIPPALWRERRGHHLPILESRDEHVWWPKRQRRNRTPSRKKRSDKQWGSKRMYRSHSPGSIWRREQERRRTVQTAPLLFCAPLLASSIASDGRHHITHSAFATFGPSWGSR